MASKQDKSPAIDPELVRRIRSAGDGEALGVTFTLRTPEGSSFLTAGETERTVQRLLKAASADAGSEPLLVKVFANLQSFLVSGSPSLVRALLGRSEIASATANEQPEDLLIRPVKPRAERDKS